MHNYKLCGVAMIDEKAAMKVDMRLHALPDVLSTSVESLVTSDLLVLDGPILDVGSFTGNLLVMAQNRLQAQGIETDIVCIDPMYAQYIGKEDLPDQFTYAQAIGERLPFADATFPLVTAFDSIHHSELPFDVIREMWRVLRPGGYMIIKGHNPRSNWRFLYSGVCDIMGNTGGVVEKLRQYRIARGRWKQGLLRAHDVGLHGGDVVVGNRQVKGRTDIDVALSFSYIGADDWLQIIEELGGNINDELTQVPFYYDFLWPLSRLDQDNCYYVIEKPDLSLVEVSPGE